MSRLPRPRPVARNGVPRSRIALAPAGSVAAVTSDHVAHNRAFWDADADAYQDAHTRVLDPGREPGWGVWHLPESELRVLGDVRGLDVLELGCGAAQWAVQLDRAGARPVGLDLSAGQLAHARANARSAATALPLVLADGERTPFRDTTFDVVFCDHGAMGFCDPAATVPEAARLLRPGGLLAFSIGTPLLHATYDTRRGRQTRRLRTRLFGRREWQSAEGTVDFMIPTGEWISLFRAHGFVIEDLLELRPPKGATTTFDYVPYSWARRWPAEQIWRVRKEVPA